MISDSGVLNGKSELVILRPRSLSRCPSTDYNNYIYYNPLPILKSCYYPFLLKYKFGAMLETLWVDKYRPRTLNDLTYHEDVNMTLRQLASTDDFPVNIFSFSISFSMGPKEQAKKQEQFLSFKKFMESILCSLQKNNVLLNHRVPLRLLNTLFSVATITLK